MIPTIWWYNRPSQGQLCKTEPFACGDGFDKEKHATAVPVPMRSVVIMPGRLTGQTTGCKTIKPCLAK
jgi:hypothetical protein